MLHERLSRKEAMFLANSNILVLDTDGIEIDKENMVDTILSCNASVIDFERVEGGRMAVRLTVDLP